MSWRAILLAAAFGLLGAAALAGWLRQPQPPPPLPPEVVRVETVREIVVPGPGRAVEQLDLTTEPRALRPEALELLGAPAPGLEGGDPGARGVARIRAVKFEGLDPETGRVEFGWTGTVDCDLDHDGTRRTLFSGPLDLRASRARGTVAPAPERPGRALGIGGGLGTEGAVLALSLERRFRWRSRTAERLLPGSLELVGTLGSRHGQIVGLAKWEF